MKSSQNLLLLLLTFFAFAYGQLRSARQDGAEEQAEAAETLLLSEENVEVAAEVTPGDIADSEESDMSKGTPEPEPEPHPETEPEPEPEGSAANSDENVEDSDDMGQQTNTSKKCQKCFRSAFRARHSEFCDGCPDDVEVDAKPLEKDADRLRRKCRRCSNSKFADKHQNFCTIRCKQSSITSEPTPTPEPPHRPITNEDLKKTKKKKERKKGQKKTNKKKGVKLPEDEESSSQLSVPLKKPIEEQELGPLENLIKYIIHQNTFTR